MGNPATAKKVYVLQSTGVNQSDPRDPHSYCGAEILASQSRSAASGVYNAHLIHHASAATMEAEQLNIIENRLTDLGQRASELRRYL